MVLIPARTISYIICRSLVPGSEKDVLKWLLSGPISETPNRCVESGEGVSD